MAQNPHTKKNFTRLAFGLYVFVVILLGVQLFFGDQFMFFANSFSAGKTDHGSAESLTIAYSLQVPGLEPTLFDSVTRSRLVNVYEGLVRTDRNLKIEPAVAVSWGLVNPTTWEFTLRPHTKFHDGTEVHVNDVVTSLDRALNYEGSQLKTLLSGIDQVAAVNDSTIRITTKTPDPLLLNKLAVTYIFPQTLKDFDHPIGTGPYMIQSWDKSEMHLKRFDQYWGEIPYYAQVDLKTISGREQRVDALKTGEVGLLADVPPSSARDLVSSSITLKSIPSLEVNFLMFNLGHGLFAEKTLREAAAYIFDRKEFVDIASGYAQGIRQFVSSGVFGFNPDLKGYDFDMEKAKTLAQPFVEQTFDPLVVTLDYAVGNDVVAEYIKAQFKLLGIDVTLNPLSGADFQQKIEAGDSDMYYLGWRSELGDANDFLQTVVHSRDANGLAGQFNGASYSNADVDNFIDRSQKDLNPVTRLKSMQDAMRILVEDDIAGVPLFETQTLFAYQSKIHFEPRVDGYIYAAEIK